MKFNETHLIDKINTKILLLVKVPPEGKTSKFWRMIYRRPFWIPASSYYVLAFSVSATIFFVVWGVLHGHQHEMPWIVAGVAASGAILGSVIIREVVIRRRERRKRLLKMQIGSARSVLDPRSSNPKKLTLEKNAEILEQIRQKSNAANILGSLSTGHREVADLCGAYLAANEAELKMISASSPRLGPLLRSRTKVMEAHRFHTLKWAEIEATSITAKIKDMRSPAEKAAAAKSALNVIEQALSSYPNEPLLVQSREALNEMTVQIVLGDHFERANVAADGGDLSAAREILKDALYFLAGYSGVPNVDDLAAEIRREIEGIDAELSHK